MSETDPYPPCNATIDLGARGIYPCYLHSGHSGSHRHNELMAAMAEAGVLYSPDRKWDGRLDGGQWVPKKFYDEAIKDRDAHSALAVRAHERLRESTAEVGSAAPVPRLSPTQEDFENANVPEAHRLLGVVACQIRDLLAELRDKPALAPIVTNIPFAPSVTTAPKAFCQWCGQWIETGAQHYCTGPNTTAGRP